MLRTALLSSAALLAAAPAYAQGSAAKCLAVPTYIGCYAAAPVLARSHALPVAVGDRQYRASIAQVLGAMIPADVTGALGYPPAALDDTGRVVPAQLPFGTAVGTVAPGNDVRIRSARTIREWSPACDGVADDSLAVSAAALALKGTGAAIAIPGDCRLRMGPAARLAGLTPVLDSVQLVGPGTRDTSESGAYGTRGGTILLTDAGGPAFVVKRGWTLRGLAFYWPAQVEDSAAPRTFPALLSGQATAGLGAASEVTSGRFVDNDVVNPWVIGDFTADISGGLQVHGNRAFCLSACWRLNVMPVESFFSGNQWTPNAYYNTAGVGIGPTYRLRDQAATKGAVIEIAGNGTASADPGGSVDGLTYSNNYAFGMGYGVRLRGGFLNISAFTGNSWDGVAKVLSVETGSRVVGTAITGGVWYAYTFGSPGIVAAPITASADARPNSSIKISHVMVPSSSGGLMDWGATTSDLTLDGINADGLNSASGATASGIRVTGAAGRLKIVGGSYAMQGSAPGPCVDVQAPQQNLVVVGVQLTTCAAPISLGGTYGTPSVIAANSSISTRGTAAYVGTQAASLTNWGNAWDKPVPGWSQATRGSDGAMVFSYAGAAQFSVSPTGNVRAGGTFTPSVTP